MKKPDGNEYLNFGQALELLKQGEKIARRGWNGKGMFIYHVPESEFIFNMNETVSSGVHREHIDMRTAQGDFVPWTASQTDLLAEDWEIIAFSHELDRFADAM